MLFRSGLMYLTPVIYPMSMLPSKIRAIVLMNPLTNYLEMFRNLAFYNTLPSFWTVVLGFLESVAAVILGVYVFYRNQDEFILNI